MSFPTGETVTVLRGTSTADRYGNETMDWSSPTTKQLYGCAVVPRRSANEGEDRSQGRQGVIVGFTVYAPAGSDVRARDRIKYRSRTFEVEGEAAEWHSPFTGWDACVEFAMRRVEG